MLNVYEKVSLINLQSLISRNKKFKIMGRDGWIEYDCEPFVLRFDYNNNIIFHYVRVPEHASWDGEFQYRPGLLFKVNDEILHDGPWVQESQKLFENIDKEFDRLQKLNPSSWPYLYNTYKDETVKTYIKKLKKEWKCNDR
jgi:hypothetical protein